MVACGDGDIAQVATLLRAENAPSSTGEKSCPFGFGKDSTSNTDATAVLPLDLNATNCDGETALMFASENGHDAVVKALLGSPGGVGVDVARRNKRGWTAWSLAARSGHLSTCELLLHEQLIRSLPASNVDAASSAAARRAIVNQQDRNGCTALVSAAGQAHRDMVTYLLGEGADLTLRDADGVSTLVRALHRGAADIALDLVQAATATLTTPAAEAFFNAQSVDGDTALTVAAAKGYADVVQALLASGGAQLNLDAQDAVGYTALMRAAARGHRDVAQLLRTAGADPGIKNLDGQTADDVAAPTVGDAVATASIITRGMMAQTKF